MENQKKEKSIKEVLETKTFTTCKKAIYEFQDLCLSLEKDYGKSIWRVPCIKGVTNAKIRDADKICKKKGIVNVKYLLGVIRNLK